MWAILWIVLVILGFLLIANIDQSSARDEEFEKNNFKPDEEEVSDDEY